MGRHGLRMVHWSGWFCWGFLGLGQLAGWGDEPVATPAPIRPPENLSPQAERAEPPRADSPPSLPLVPPPPSPDAGWPGRDPVLEEIVRLRRTLGGSLPNDPHGERAFTDALRQLSRPPALPPYVPPLGPGVPGDAIPRLPFPTELTPPDDVVVPTRRSLTRPSVSGVLVTLHGSSRELDMRAYDLDERQQYEAADRLRKLARQLRREARRLESEGEASSR